MQLLVVGAVWKSMFHLDLDVHMTNFPSSLLAPLEGPLTFLTPFQMFLFTLALFQVEVSVL